MPLLRTEEILNIFAQSTKNNKKDIDTDISSLLEEYLVEAGLRCLNDGVNAEQLCPNFPEIAVILQHSGIIYSRKVDNLWSIVQNYVTSAETPTTSDGNEEKVFRRIKKQPENLEFIPISLTEASNITMKDNVERKTAAVLPRAFMQFEPRIISENDVQIKDYTGTLIGLINDFKVNWNMDKKFTLCDDMDFSSTSGVHKTTENILHPSMVSPPDSGHVSDSFFDYCDNVMGSPDIHSERSPSICSPVAVPLENTKVVKERKRKIPQDSPQPKKIPTKYDITTPLVGTAKSLRLEFSDFFLPYSYNRFYVEKLNNVLKVRNFINNLRSKDDMNKTFHVNEVSSILKKRPCLTWTRLEARKKLKLSLLDSDSFPEESGSSDEEDSGVALYNLEKACDRLSLQLSDNDKLSECNNDTFMDDDEECYIGSQCRNMLNVNRDRQWAEVDLNPSSNSQTGESSDASKKMEAWHSSILEKIKNMENQKPLDLKFYSQRILDTFNDECNTKNFSRVLEDAEPEDISRYFLSTLFLADKCKIVIQQPPPLTCGDFQITLPQDNRISEDDLNFSLE